VGRDGVATIWAITSTISGNGDVGADPNRLVAIRDVVANVDSSAAGKSKFFTLRTADFAEVLRGVSFTPGTDIE
jgi:muramidase (phage lysozyme)